jgi:hypothetical protein
VFFFVGGWKIANGFHLNFKGKGKNATEKTFTLPQCFHSGQNELAPAAAAELLVLE